MPVAFDVQGTGVGGVNATTFTESAPQITVGSGLNRALVLLLGVAPFIGGSISGVTAFWDAAGTNQAMTQIGAVTEGTNLGQIFMFGLLAPTSGAKLLRASWTTSAIYNAWLFSFTGAGSFRNFISGNQPTANTAGAYPPGGASLNCPVGDIGFFGAGSRGGAIFATTAGGAGQTGTWLFNSFAAHMTAIYIAGAGASTICSVRQTDLANDTACWAAFDIAQPGPASFGVVIG